MRRARATSTPLDLDAVSVEVSETEQQCKSCSWSQNIAFADGCDAGR
jgi:hypothetical protein